MASGSRNTLFGMTLTELVIILFFIMLLLALDSIDDLNDQIPDSSEDVVAASAVVELLIPDGEINSDLIPFEVIKDEIAKLQKDKEELEDIKQASEGDGDGDCKEGGNWINSKCADFCWATESDESKRKYDVLLDVGMCESSIVVQRSQWLKNSESNFVQVPGALEAVQQNIMSKDELYTYLDEIKKPGYEKNPRQCFHVVRLVQLEQLYADPWTKNVKEVQSRVSTELYTLNDYGYKNIRSQFPDNVCNVINDEEVITPVSENEADFPEIKSFQEPVSLNEEQVVTENTLSIVNADLDIDSFQAEASKQCDSSIRFRNKDITLEFIIEIDSSGKAVSVELAANNPSLNSSSSRRLSRIALKALEKSSYIPQKIEGVTINSFHNEKLKFPSNFCNFDY